MCKARLQAKLYDIIQLVSSPAFWYIVKALSQRNGGHDAPSLNGGAAVMWRY